MKLPAQARNWVKTTLSLTQTKLVYSRITLTRYTSIYFLFTFIACAVLSALQGVILNEHSKAVNILQEAIDEAELPPHMTRVVDGYLEVCDGVPGRLSTTCTPVINMKEGSAALQKRKREIYSRIARRQLQKGGVDEVDLGDRDDLSSVTSQDSVDSLNSVTSVDSVDSANSITSNDSNGRVLRVPVQLTRQRKINRRQRASSVSSNNSVNSVSSANSLNSVTSNDSRRGGVLRLPTTGATAAAPRRNRFNRIDRRQRASSVSSNNSIDSVSSANSLNSVSSNDSRRGDVLNLPATGAATAAPRRNRTNRLNRLKRRQRASSVSSNNSVDSLNSVTSNNSLNSVTSNDSRNGQDIRLPTGAAVAAPRRNRFNRLNRRQRASSISSNNSVSSVNSINSVNSLTSNDSRRGGVLRLPGAQVAAARRNRLNRLNRRQRASSVSSNNSVDSLNSATSNVSRRNGAVLRLPGQLRAFRTSAGLKQNKINRRQRASSVSSNNSVNSVNSISSNDSRRGRVLRLPTQSAAAPRRNRLTRLNRRQRASSVSSNNSVDSVNSISSNDGRRTAGRVLQLPGNVRGAAVTRGRTQRVTSSRIKRRQAPEDDSSSSSDSGVSSGSEDLEDEDEDEDETPVPAATTTSAGTLFTATPTSFGTFQQTAASCTSLSTILASTLAEAPQITQVATPIPTSLVEISTGRTFTTAVFPTTSQFSFSSLPPLPTGVPLPGTAASQEGGFSVADSCSYALSWLEDTIHNSEREDVVIMVSQLWMLCLGVFAIFFESLPHLIAVFLAHVLEAGWSASRIVSTRSLAKIYSHVIVPTACDGKNLLGEWFNERMVHSIPILVVNGLSVLMLGLLTWKLFKVYTYQTFSRVGSSPQVHKLYKMLLCFAVVLQLSTFFGAASAAMWIHKMSSLQSFAEHWKLYVSAFAVYLALLLPWALVGWKAMRTESKIHSMNFFAISALLVVISSLMFRSTLYRAVFTRWSFFATVATTAFIFVFITTGLGIVCALNFNKGLARYLDVTEALDGDDFTPVNFGTSGDRKIPLDDAESQVDAVWLDEKHDEKNGMDPLAIHVIAITPSSQQTVHPLSAHFLAPAPGQVPPQSLRLFNRTQGSFYSDDERTAMGKDVMLSAAEQEADAAMNRSRWSKYTDISSLWGVRRGGKSARTSMNTMKTRRSSGLLDAPGATA